MIETIITGIVGGIAYSLTAWGKKEGQPFEVQKFASTVVIGAVVGVAVPFLNLPFDAAYQMLLSFGIVPIVENVVKVIWRKVFGK